MRIASCLVVAGLLSSIVAPVRTQSLAEVAKKQEEQRKSTKGTSKVYTNKDLKGVPAPSPSSPSTPLPADTTKPTDTAAGPAEATPSPAAAAPSETKDRAYWSQRIQEAREQIARDRVLLDALQTRVNSLDADVVNRDDPAQRAKLMNDRERALVELERQKKAVAAGEKAVAATEEEARRAGVPPGWLR
jgi:hypothetical protein